VTSRQFDEWLAKMCSASDVEDQIRKNKERMYNSYFSQTGRYNTTGPNYGRRSDIDAIMREVNRIGQARPAEVLSITRSEASADDKIAVLV